MERMGREKCKPEMRYIHLSIDEFLGVVFESGLFCKVPFFTLDLNNVFVSYFNFEIIE